MLMPLFEKKYAGYLTAYKIPIAPNQLDPTVFYTPDEGGEYKLLPSIHAQIARDLELMTGNDQPHRIKGYYMVGPAVTPGDKNKNGDIKIIVYINNDIKNVDINGTRAEMLLQVANELSNKKAIGTTRDIVYIPTVRPPDPKTHEAIYDLLNHSWIKTPNGLR